MNKKFPISLVVFFAVLLVSGLSAGVFLFSSSFSKSSRSAQHYRMIKPGELQTYPEVAMATRKFFERGGKYDWGPNDCSVFVTDVLKSSGAEVTQRYTTVELADASLMKKLGFFVKPSPSKHGDLIVFRYLNSERKARGHCGVVVVIQNQTYVLHNTSRFGGLVLQTLSSFQQDTAELQPFVHLTFSKLSEIE